MISIYAEGAFEKLQIRWDLKNILRRKKEI
jgi:hypothetical protein